MATPGTTVRSHPISSQLAWLIVRDPHRLLQHYFRVDPYRVSKDSSRSHSSADLSPRSTQMRHGGDIAGLVNDRTLDYLELMGVKVLYISGSIFLCDPPLSCTAGSSAHAPCSPPARSNLPWQADGYSVLDFTLLDPHFGSVADWGAAIDKIHARGM